MATANTELNVQAIVLPSELSAGLVKLIRRTSGLSETAAKNAFHALFGDEPPTFGQVQRLTADELSAAFGRAKCAGAVPITALRELAECLARVTPDLPHCDACGDFPLTNVGGRVAILPHGSSCPFCASGHVSIVPMKLRRLAWTDGRLVEPQTVLDLRARPGEKLPLTDEGILDWIGGDVFPDLEQTLKAVDVPLYGFLAYMRVYRRAFTKLEDAAVLLQHPKRFGLTDQRLIEEAVESAATFLAEREITNLPHSRGATPFGGKRFADAERLVVSGRPYIVEGLVGRGEHTHVYRGFWDHTPSETVIIKVNHDVNDAYLKRERETLTELGDSEVQGAEFFTRIIPQIVVAGDCTLASGEKRQATVFRYKNRFDWTLADAREEYPDGADAETGVWMWNRLLLLLTWLHSTGVAHGNIRPEHVLIHPLNHGATLVGWSQATRFNVDVTPETDIIASAQCIIAVLGGDLRTGALPAHVPASIADILRVHAGFPNKGHRLYASAEDLYEAFKQVARDVYGTAQVPPVPLAASALNGRQLGLLDASGAATMVVAASPASSFSRTVRHCRRMTMGYGSYSHEGHRALTTARETLPEEEVFTQQDLHEDMNPHGVVARESRDSAAHPNSVAIIFALDETGSMGGIPVQLAKKELPNFMGTVMKFIADPQVMFMAIGDAEQTYRELAPLQVGQFESEAELMDRWLTSIFLERSGGGNAGESYDLGFYFAARHTIIDCYEKRGHKGYFFMTGDEPHLGRVNAKIVKRICGDTLKADIPMADIVAEVCLKYHAFYLIPDLGRRARCEDGWREVLGDNVICLEDPADTCLASGVLVGLTEGTLIDLDDAGRKLESFGVARQQANRIIRAVEPYATSIGRGGPQKPVETGRGKKPARSR